MLASYASRRPAGLPSSTPQAVVEDATDSELEQDDTNQSLVAVTSRQSEHLTATQLATRAGIQPNSRLMARLQSSTATITTSAWLNYQPPVQRPTEPIRKRGRPRRVTEIAADSLPTPHLKREDSTKETLHPQRERRTARAHVPRAVFMPEAFQPRPSGSRRSTLHFDAYGQPLPKRKPGRPRIHPLPEDRHDGARTSSLLSLGPVGSSLAFGSAQPSAPVLGKRRASDAFSDTESETNLKKTRRATLASLEEDEEGKGLSGSKKKRRATLAFPLTEGNDNEDDEDRKNAAAAGIEGDDDEDNSEDELALHSKPELKVILKLPRRQNLTIASSAPTNANLAQTAAAVFVPTPAWPSAPGSWTADLGKK